MTCQTESDLRAAVTTTKRKAPTPSPDRRRIRLSDVAHAAGVSTMTVVRVLRDPQQVAAGTHARARRAILRKRATRRTSRRARLPRNAPAWSAPWCPLLTNSLIAEIMQGMTDALAHDGFQMLLGVSGFSSSRGARARAGIPFPSHRRHLPDRHTRTPETVRMLKRAGIPVVEGGNITGDPVDMVVGYSNVDAASEITRYLVKRGYAPVGYIGAFPEDNDRARDRRAGLREGARRGPPPDRSGAVHRDHARHRRRCRRDGEPACAAAKVRAVFCSADALAVGALCECHRRGLDVPREVAIAGFDDIVLAAQVVPALTTIRVPRYEIGHRAGTMLCDRLGRRPVRRRIFDTGFELVPRASA